VSNLGYSRRLLGYGAVWCRDRITAFRRTLLPPSSWSLQWAGHVAKNGETRNACRIVLGKLVGKYPIGRPRKVL
jgi:hypothetical protein